MGPCKERLGHRREITTQNFASSGKMIGILPCFFDRVICIFSYKLQAGTNHTGDKCRMASSCCSGEQTDLEDDLPMQGCAWWPVSLMQLTLEFCSRADKTGADLPSDWA